MMEFYEGVRELPHADGLHRGPDPPRRARALGSNPSSTGPRLDLSKPFHRHTIVEGDPQSTPPGLHRGSPTGRRRLAEGKIVDFGEKVKPGGLGSLQLQLFEACAEAELWEPTFIIDYPVEVSPLARRTTPTRDHRALRALHRRPRIANGFSELNDPEDQAARFRPGRGQEAGDEEAMYYDADYIRALEYGLPRPAAAASASTAW